MFYDIISFRYYRLSPIIIINKKLVKIQFSYGYNKYKTYQVMSFDDVGDQHFSYRALSPDRVRFDHKIFETQKRSILIVEAHWILFMFYNL